MNHNDDELNSNIIIESFEPIDFDPLVDVEITFEVLAIRALDKIDLFSDPDLYIKVFINGEEFCSDIWFDKRVVYDTGFSTTFNVPDDEEFVDIKIQLFDWNSNKENLCDLDSEDDYDVDLFYNIKTGHWSGDDILNGDPSGYGRLNGCDDGSIYRNERDCELWFSITQNDFDGDGIPYWAEKYAFGTDPTFDNRGQDFDDDQILIEWEYKWNYNPKLWDDHLNLDPDNDGLNNYEEFLTSIWGSDPYRRDLFLELDVMEEGPKGQKCFVTDGTKELLKDPYDRRNIVYHLDDGCMGGGEIIPFDKKTYPRELIEMYNTYFLKNGSNSWRRGVFHYGMIIYQHYSASGIAYVGEKLCFNCWHVKGINTFVVSHKIIYNYVKIKTQKRLDYTFACAIMHETGHTFGIDFLFPPGCDNLLTLYPWQLCYWLFRNYKSCMNYRYAFDILDYSDGSHGRRDYDDWGNLDFKFFELDE